MTIPPRHAARLAVLVPMAAALLLAALPATAARDGVPRLQSIALDPPSFSLLPGATRAVRAIGTFTDGSTRDITAAVVFRSRDAKVATVDHLGLVTAVAGGRTEIGATEPASRLGSRSNAKVTVAKLKALAVAPVETTLRVGGEVPLQALGTFDDGTTGVDLTARVQWSSNKGSVATVVARPDGGVAARGVAAGVTSVIARDPSTGVKSSSSSGIVRVVGRLVEIRLSPARKAVRVGERSRVKAMGTFERGAQADVSADVDWSTADPSVASVDAEGRVRGVAVGTTTVRATDRATGITSTASAADTALSVVGDVIALRVTPASVVLPLDGKASLKASASFAGQDATVNFTTKVEWTSSAPGLVAVDRLGVATCKARGTAFASARDGATGVTSTATGGDARILCGIGLSGIRVVPDKVTLGPGKTKKVKAWLVYEDGAEIDATKQVEWTTSDRKIAGIETQDPNIGRVTGVGDGIATIVARDPATGRSSDDPGGTSCTVTVQGQPTSIQIEPDPTKKRIIEGSAGGTLKLKVLAKFLGGSSKGLDAFVTWHSSAPEVVAVSNGDDGERPGTARFLQPGSAIVTITYPKGEPPPGVTVLTYSVTVNVQ